MAHDFFQTRRQRRRSLKRPQVDFHQPHRQQIQEITLQNKLNPSEVNTLQPDGESLTGSHARNVDDRAMPRNDWDSWDDVNTNCKESFRNLSEPTTGEVLVTHQPVRRSFYDLIKPIFSNKTGIDSTVYKKRDGTVKDIDDIIKKEENFLNRFEYEYFSMNIGTAAYIGTGSSIKKTSSDILFTSILGGAAFYLLFVTIKEFLNKKRNTSQAISHFGFSLFILSIL